eukprot:scaffold2646_cov226-Pinguiococcus_pyrenoidosus.AAC.2
MKRGSEVSQQPGQHHCVRSVVVCKKNDGLVLCKRLLHRSRYRRRGEAVTGDLPPFALRRFLPVFRLPIVLPLTAIAWRHRSNCCGAVQPLLLFASSSCFLRRARGSQGNGELHDGPLLSLGLFWILHRAKRPQAAAHDTGELPRNVQAESGAADGSFHAATNLLEWLAESFQVSLGHAYAVVLHRNKQPYHLAILTLIGALPQQRRRRTCLDELVLDFVDVVRRPDEAEAILANPSREGWEGIEQGALEAHSAGLLLSQELEGVAHEIFADLQDLLIVPVHLRVGREDGAGLDPLYLRKPDCVAGRA